LNRVGFSRDGLGHQSFFPTVNILSKYTPCSIWEKHPKKDTNIEWYESECDNTQYSIWEFYPEMVNNVKE